MYVDLLVSRVIICVNLIMFFTIFEVQWIVKKYSNYCLDHHYIDTLILPLSYSDC